VASKNNGALRVRCTRCKITFAPTKNDCKNGGFLALGFSNQGQCVSYFMNNTP
jgi:hypothetical protein